MRVAWLGLMFVVSLGCASGWQFGKQADGVTEDLSRVVLCGSACDRARNDPSIQVDVVLGCQPLLLE